MEETKNSKENSKYKSDTKTYTISIDVSRRNLGDEFISSLIETKIINKQSLTKLNLTYNNITEAGIRILFQSNYFSNLNELNLNFNTLDNDTLKYLAKVQKIEFTKI